MNGGKATVVAIMKTVFVSIKHVNLCFQILLLMSASGAGELLLIVITV
jgi:hypothetical protein